MTFSAEQKRKAAEREASYRKFVYPKRVAARKMTQEKADREIAIMQEIASDYRAIEDPPAQRDLLSPNPMETK